MIRRRRSNLACWISAAASGALVALPCAASPLTAASMQSRLQSDVAACPAGAPKLKIERVAIVGSSQHNKIRLNMGAKADGQAGQRYAAIYVRSGKQVASVASFGPLDASVKLDDLAAPTSVAWTKVEWHTLPRRRTTRP